VWVGLALPFAIRAKFLPEPLSMRMPSIPF
jgi:hypothetical protein